MINFVFGFVVAGQPLQSLIVTTLVPSIFSNKESAIS